LSAEIDPVGGVDEVAELGHEVVGLRVDPGRTSERARAGGAPGGRRK
jgi:hypothetical protein